MLRSRYDDETDFLYLLSQYGNEDAHHYDASPTYAGIFSHVNEPMFLTQKGNRMTPNGLWKSLASKQRYAQLLTGVHRFRHTFLTDVDRNNSGNAAVSRDLAGHKSVSVTNTYLHTTADERQKVVNSMSYAELLSR